MRKRKLKKKYILIIICLFIFVIINITWNKEIVRAADKHPDIILNVYGEGTNGEAIFKEEGEIAGDILWAPGVTKRGVIRIHNNYSEKVRISNLSLTMKLEKLQGDNYVSIKDKGLYELYAENMNLNIKIGTMLVFKNSIYNKNFYEMLYDPDDENYEGYDLSLLDEFDIPQNEYVDLEYTVHMNEQAGNELQGFKANVDFLINFQ